MSYVWYNQIQANHFNLNHTQAIIMNYMSYWLPHFAVSKMMEDSKWTKRTYFFWAFSKQVNDMPTLKVSQTTMRKNINDLIQLGVLERKILYEWWKNSAWYRVTSKWLTQSPQHYPSDFNTLHSIIEDNLDNWTYSKSNAERLIETLSSYLDKTSSSGDNSTDFQITEWEWEDALPNIIISHILKWKEAFDPNKIKVVDNDTICQILDRIKKHWELRKWYKTWFSWDPEQDTVNKISSKFEWMLEWHIIKRDKLKV